MSTENRDKKWIMLIIFGAKKEDWSPQEAHKSCKILKAAVPKTSQTSSITTPNLNRKVSDKYLRH